MSVENRVPRFVFSKYLGQECEIQLSCEGFPQLDLVWFHSARVGRPVPCVSSSVHNASTRTIALQSTEMAEELLSATNTTDFDHHHVYVQAVPPRRVILVY